jgi:hypothetical protein
MIDRLRDMDDSELLRFRSRFADDFVREDRRRLIAVPDSDRDDWFESILAYWDLGKGAPSFRVAEVLAVRGERLVLLRARVEYEDGSATGMLIVCGLSADMRVRHAVMFDIDDLDAAFAELDRLHEEIGAKDAQPPFP